MAKPSSEHIIHNFLGGSLEGPLLDDSTNSILGHSIDAALHRNLQELLLRLDLRGNTSSEPPRTKNRVATDEEGRSWRLTAGGQLECENVRFRVFEVSVTDRGELQLNIAVDGGSHLTAESVTQMILTRLRRDPRVPAVLRQRPLEAWEGSRQQIETMMRKSLIQEQTDIVWTTTFQISDATLRAVAKIACNFFAYHNREAFCGTGFDIVRRFVLHNEGDPPVQLFYPPLPETGAMGHGVSFEVHEGGAATAAVTLFGHLCHRVNLGQVADGAILPVRSSFYVVDQPGRTSRGGVPVDPLVPYDHSCSILDSIEMFAPLQRENLIRVVEVADMVRELASLPESATKSDRDRIVEERTARIMDALVRNGVIWFRSRPGNSS